MSSFQGQAACSTGTALSQCCQGGNQQGTAAASFGLGLARKRSSLQHRGPLLGESRSMEPRCQSMGPEHCSPFHLSRACGNKGTRREERGRAMSFFLLFD